MNEGPDPKKRKLDELSFVSGMEQQDVGAIDIKISEILQEMETELKDGRSFLVGDSYTLADVVGTCFCARVNIIRAEAMFGSKVQAYWCRMKGRLSFRQAY